jgi:carboxylesterase
MVNVKTPGRFKFSVGRILLIALVAVTLFVGVMFIKPVDTVNYVAAANPVATHEEAGERIARAQLGEVGVKKQCGTYLYTHGRKVAHAVVMVHGFTACPYQFTKLAEALYVDGFNVLIHRLPQHGLDMSGAQALATFDGEAAVRSVNETIDTAFGLGNQVTLVGLSFGASAATWVAHHRSDLKSVVILAPAYGVAAIPGGLHKFAANILAILPPITIAYDKLVPEYSYQSYSSRALAQLLRIGQAVLTQTDRAVPAEESITIVVVENDAVIRREYVDDVIQNWEHQGYKTRQITLPTSMKLRHDFVDPFLEDAKPEHVYPMLIDLIKNP